MKRGGEGRRRGERRRGEQRGGGEEREGEIEMFRCSVHFIASFCRFSKSVGCCYNACLNVICQLLCVCVSVNITSMCI